MSDLSNRMRLQAEDLHVLSPASETVKCLSLGADRIEQLEALIRDVAITALSHWKYFNNDGEECCGYCGNKTDEHRKECALTKLREQVDRANASEAISASLLEINRDLLMRNYVSHELFQIGDPGCPEQALDWNGEVALGVCKNCGRVEVELDEHCDHRTLIKNLRAEIASLTSPKG